MSSKKFASGAIVLVIGGFICKAIGALHRIPLTNILGAEGMGVYQLIFPVYALFLVCCTGGIPIALSKLVAESRAKSEYRLAKKYFYIALFILLIISTIFMIFFFVFAEWLSNIQGNSQAALGYRVIAIAILFASVLAAFRGYFQGFENMKPTALSQILEQISKLIFGISFALWFIKNGVQWGVFGAVLGVTISEFCSFLYLYIYFLLSKKKYAFEETSTIKTNENMWFHIRKLILVALPITLNSMILPFVLATDSFLIVNMLTKTGISSTDATSLFGIYSGVVNSLINFPTIFSIALATAIVPSVSFSVAKNNEKHDEITTAFKIIFIVAIPCFIVFVMMAPQIISILYPSGNIGTGTFFGVASGLLRISAINVIYITIVQLTTAILYAYEKTLVSLINMFIGGVMKIVVTIILVRNPYFNIFGASLASIICFTFVSLSNLNYIKKHITFSIVKKELMSILSASMIFAIILFSSNFVLNLIFSQLTSMLLSSIASLGLYMVALIFLPAFSKEELYSIPFGKNIYSIKSSIRKK